MRVKSGTLDVLHSGSVVCGGDRTVEFALDEETPMITVRLVFVTDENLIGHDLSMRLPEPTILEVVCKNFNNTLGTGTVSPLKIGFTKGRHLYLSFLVTALRNADQYGRTVHYSFLLGDKVQK